MMSPSGCFQRESSACQQRMQGTVCSKIVYNQGVTGFRRTATAAALGQWPRRPGAAAGAASGPRLAPSAADAAARPPSCCSPCWRPCCWRRWCQVAALMAPWRRVTAAQGWDPAARWMASLSRHSGFHPPPTARFARTRPFSASTHVHTTIVKPTCCLPPRQMCSADRL